MMFSQFMKRPAIGLVLGGGGVRSLAEVGVLKVLEKEGIPIDMLAGSSMGGVIAALTASGISANELECQLMALSQTRNLVRLLDLSPPHRGLIKGERIRDHLAALLGGASSFADLRTPLVLAATDLNAGRTVLLQEGPLLPAIMATAAFPGILPPVEMGDQRLSDGGILDNVPVDGARRLGAERVIAVDASPVQGEAQAAPESQTFLTNLVPDFAVDFYRIELMMSAAITQARLAESMPDIVIRPDLAEDISVFSGLNHAEEIILAGEMAAREALPAIRKLVAPRWRWQRLMSAGAG